ncbi:hypothetical protein [Desulfosarcina cetonica]|uniref:hypothetical protein n=1 Tax=Desulfosarcina cetonica TaxID=90730 RepID=UPI0012EE5975|nr:hypothetical protein [Desulfosarcina cetonica]
MGLKFDSLKCTSCMACELACGYHRDEALAMLASSIVTYRNREKKNYFGIMLKEPENLVLSRPEGWKSNASVSWMKTWKPTRPPNPSCSGRPAICVKMKKRDLSA